MLLLFPSRARCFFNEKLINPGCLITKTPFYILNTQVSPSPMKAKVGKTKRLADR